MRNHFAVVILGFACLMGAGELRAQDAWTYEFTPSLWLSGGDGTTFFLGEEGPVSLEFDELSSLEPGMSATVQGQKTKWGWLVDGAYGRSAVGDQDWSLMFVSGGATYQLTDKKAFVNLVFGARWASSSGGLRIIDPDEPDPDSDDDKFKKESANDGWVDLMVGLQVVRPFGDRWGMEAYIDAGAGQSDLTYQAMAGLTYRVSPAVTAKAGYRLIGADYDDDSSEVDMKFGGVYFGAGFKF